MKPYIVVDENGKKLLMKPVIEPKFPLAATCNLTKNETWLLARAKCSNTGVMRTQVLEERKGILTTFQYVPCNQVILMP